MNEGHWAVVNSPRATAGGSCVGGVSVVFGDSGARLHSAPGDPGTCWAGSLAPQGPTPGDWGLLGLSKGEVLTPARLLWTFPTSSSSSSQAQMTNVPWQLQRKRAFDEGALGGARFYLLTIKMSASLGSFLNQYLLF